MKKQGKGVRRRGGENVITSRREGPRKRQNMDIGVRRGGEGNLFFQFIINLDRRNIRVY